MYFDRLLMKKGAGVGLVFVFPLGEVIQNREATGRIVKWALELMDQGIMYAP